MRAIYTLCFSIVSCAILHAADPAYEIELQRAMRLYPPGDYNAAPATRFSPITTFEKVVVSPAFDLLEPVEPSDKDIKTLFSEAASCFTAGRWDLATKRYKQSLLLDPENRDAKACLYDILLLRSLYGDESRRSEAVKRQTEINKRLLKDINPPEE